MSAFGMPSSTVAGAAGCSSAGFSGSAIAVSVFGSTGVPGSTGVSAACSAVFSSAGAAAGSSVAATSSGAVAGLVSSTFSAAGSASGTVISLLGAPGCSTSARTCPASLSGTDTMAVSVEVATTLSGAVDRSTIW